ncbi:hypothetical protein VST7929_00149 [Vibrio stylophorae]|uniref:AsmA domain-containing protein n=1 Tax=Vibrio stylophorae TaxID=659351 RepID=A0ABN8DQS2_9VIBR|nr:AsmA family protein [Vibrio stylophorae]CAH0532331.1 hypothetical protein VST7929_00149 [Vibrio stylophorae]
MLRLIKLLLSLVIVIMVAFGSALAVLHTQYAVPMVQWLVEKTTPYALEVADIDYHIESPWEITLSQVTLTDQQKQTQSLSAERVQLWLTPFEILRGHWHFDTILIAAPNFKHWQPDQLLSKTFVAKRLAIHHFHYSQGDIAFVDGKLQLDNWTPSNDDLWHFDGEFQFSAKQLTWHQSQLDQILFSGHKQGKQWTFSGISADFLGAQLRGDIRVDESDRTIRVTGMTISDLRLQNWQPLRQLKQQFEHYGQAGYHLLVERLDIMGMSVAEENHSVEELNIAVHRFDTRKGRWQQKDAIVSLQASDLIWDHWQIQNPLLELRIQPNRWYIDGASLKMLDGYICLEGEISPQQAKIHKLDINSIKWISTGPVRHALQAYIATLDNLAIDELAVHYSHYIDPDEDWPMQLSALNGAGKQLILKRDGQYGLWHGELQLSATQASFNQVDLRTPELIMSTEKGQWQMALNTLFSHGLMQATMQMDLAQISKPWQLSIKADGIPANLYQRWFQWPLPILGDHDLTLNLSGLAADRTALNHTLSGDIRYEFRDLRLDRMSEKTLWQQLSDTQWQWRQSWPLEKLSKSVTLDDAKGEFSIDRGELKLPATQLQGQQMQVMLKGNWRFAHPKQQNLTLQVDYDCHRLSRQWSQGQSELKTDERCQ